MASLHKHKMAARDSMLGSDVSTRWYRIPLRKIEDIFNQWLMINYFKQELYVLRKLYVYKPDITTCWLDTDVTDNLTTWVLSLPVDVQARSCIQTGRGTPTLLNKKSNFKLDTTNFIPQFVANKSNF